MSKSGALKNDELENQSDSAEADRPICFCHAVSLKRLKDEIQAGAKTFEELQAETNCSTGCGGCEFDVRELLEKELSKK